MNTFTVSSTGVTAGLAISKFLTGKGEEVRGVTVSTDTYIRIADEAFKNRHMTKLTSASISLMGGKNKVNALIAPKGENGIIVLFQPGPGSWTTAVKIGQNCPNQGKVLKGVKCPTCKENLPAWRSSSLQYSDKNIHPKAGTVPGTEVYKTWKPDGKTSFGVLDVVIAPAHWASVLVLKAGAKIRVATPGGVNILAFDGKALTYSAETAAKAKAAAA